MSGADASLAAESTSDPAVNAYLVSAGRIAVTMGDSLDRVRNLMGTAEPSDPDWRRQVATELAVWQGSYEQAKALNPPPKVASAHATFVKALATYDAASRDIASALDSSDSTQLQTALRELASAQQQMLDANQQLRAALSQ